MTLALPLQRLSLFIRVVIAADLILACLWFGYVVNAIAPQTSKSYDAIITLMGDFNDNYSELGTETTRRLNHALSLGGGSKDTVFVCIGGSRPRSGVVGAEMMRTYLEAHHIAPQQIITGFSSYDTLTNLEEADSLLTGRNWEHIGLVSSPLHLFRIATALKGKRDDRKYILLPYPYSSTRPHARPAQIWKVIHYEWATYLLYRLPAPLYRTVIGHLRQQTEDRGEAALPAGQDTAGQRQQATSGGDVTLPRPRW